MKAVSCTTTKVYRREGVCVTRSEGHDGTVGFVLEIDGLEQPYMDWGWVQQQQMAQAGRGNRQPRTPGITRTPSQLAAIVEVIQSALEGK